MYLRNAPVAWNFTWYPWSLLQHTQTDVKINVWCKNIVCASVFLSASMFHHQMPCTSWKKDAWTERPRRTNSSLLCTSRIIRWLLPSANPIQWRTTIYDFHLFSSSWENNLQSSVMCRHVWSHRINRWESHDWIYVVPPSDSGVISAHPQLGADRSWSERNPGQTSRSCNPIAYIMNPL